MCLVLVVCAGAATAWWAGHRIGVDLSAISAVASVLGLGESKPGPPAPVGHLPGAPDAGAPAALAGAEPAPGPTNDCDAGASPAYDPAFAALQEQLGDEMGAPIECAHTASPDGDTVQMTTAGLAAYDPATDTASFTDGWRHWAITPLGLETWEGTDPRPPTG